MSLAGSRVMRVLPPLPVTRMFPVAGSMSPGLRLNTSLMRKPAPAIRRSARRLRYPSEVRCEVRIASSSIRIS